MSSLRSPSTVVLLFRLLNNIHRLYIKLRVPAFGLALFFMFHRLGCGGGGGMRDSRFRPGYIFSTSLQGRGWGGGIKNPCNPEGPQGKHPLVGVDGFEPPTLCL